MTLELILFLAHLNKNELALLKFMQLSEAQYDQIRSRLKIKDRNFSGIEIEIQNDKTIICYLFFSPFPGCHFGIHGFVLFPSESEQS